MINKKGSVSIFFLIISILIISSGAIITQEFITSDNENNAGTGLVLLNDEQDNQLSSFDSSSFSNDFLNDKIEDDNINGFVKKYSSKSSSHSKSSSSSSSSSSSNSDSSESDSVDNPPENLGLENSQPNNSIDDENKNLESISSEEIPDKIFKINGIEYIIRDNKTYKLASSTEIRFSPALPSSVYIGEKINIKLLGTLSPSLNLNGFAACVYSGVSFGADIELKVMEADSLSFDDLIASKTFHISIDCDNLKVDYSHIFENVVLSDQFGEGILHPDKTRIEVYGLVKLTSNYIHNLEYSTPEYKIEKETCTSHSTYKCYNRDVYWYDSCDNREDKKSECSSDSCGSWGSNYCKTNDVYHKKTCHDRGCSGSSCFDNIYTEEEKVQECGTQGCTNGQCIEAGEVFTKSLTEGWNTVALTIQPEDTAVASVLYSIEGKYNNVWAEVNGNWLSYSPTVLPLTNTLKYLEGGMTFIIQMIQDATLTITGS